jgi:hypothetical protein
MSPSSSSPALSARPGGAPRGRGSRPRRLIAWTGGVVALVVVALAAAALIPGSHATPNDGARQRVAGGAPAGADPAGHVSTVFDSRIAASRYGTKIAQMENGVDARGRPISDLSPLPARDFRRPIAEFRHYAERWAGRLGRDTASLTAALRTGDRARSRRAWNRAFAAYLHLGAVYGLLPGALDDRLAEIPSSLADRRFPGLHRIERGLWRGARPRSLVAASNAVGRAAARLPHVVATVVITPLSYATRTHEILEDAQRDLMSGADVPWSGEGVLGTAAGLAATRELVRTLVPLLQGRENTLAETEYWLAHLGAALRSVRRPDGTLPTLDQLSTVERERLDGTLAGTLNALSAVPGTLETRAVRQIPLIAGGGGGAR